MQSEDFAYLYDLEEKFWWFVGMRAITAALLDPVCAPGRDRLILDDGCGTGGNLEWLKRYAGNGKVVGLDLETDALGFCRERRHERLTRASATDLPFADAVFDLVTSFDVLPHVCGEGADERAMREMFRVLRPGGIAFVRAAAYEWMRSGHDRALGGQRRYRLGLLSERLERAGFHILRATYANTLLLPAAALRRLVLQRVGLANRGSDVKPLPPRLGWLERVLTGALRREAQLLASPGVTLRFGLSAICIARKA
ncbi:MAG TPA: methyltransferase domain-containing protein [Blastocatellia bacterium]|nr:methyltransferase domain-containing protein [Blastocatellia bacterium]